MPPAFVLSQNQTLKFLNDPYAAGKNRSANEPHFKEPFLHNTYGVYWDIGSQPRTPQKAARTIRPVERLVYLAPDALKPSDEGAAAHMSLHQNRQ
jgi:hypothetical protein